MALQAVKLDVSQLAAPEPMRAILIALSSLKQGSFLMVSHRMEPMPLYAKLSQLDLHYVVQEINNIPEINFFIGIGFAADMVEIAQRLRDESIRA